MATPRAQSGTAMVEAAIVFPCLVLLVMWSAAITDVMVLKLKGAEAARFSLWETTAFRKPAEIDADMQARFSDLRSPKAINVAHTGLMLYPQAANIQWKAHVDTSQAVSVGGNFKPPPSGNWLQAFFNAIASGLARTTDGEMAREGFNTRGGASVQVELVDANHDASNLILKGGDLPFLRGGKDFNAPPRLNHFSFKTPLASEVPMRLVFDTWKAWPQGSGTSPSRTYPEVEKQVSQQVTKIAFFGLKKQGWFNAINNGIKAVFNNGVATWLLGGHVPDVFSTATMDGNLNDRGPITILPPEKANASFVPSRCTGGPCVTQRIGDFTSSGNMQRMPDWESLGNGVDRTRYTIPYKINTDYWRDSGGTEYPDAMGQRLFQADSRIKTQNEYVKTYQCRGHYFLGSKRAQENTPSRRWTGSCYR